MDVIGFVLRRNGPKVCMDVNKRTVIDTNKIVAYNIDIVHCGELYTVRKEVLIHER